MKHVLALAVLLLPHAVPAITLRVPADHATIQDAVDAAGAGDVILVSKGSYDPFTVDGKTNLTIKGKGKPIVDASGMAAPAAIVQDSSGVVLEGFVFRSPDPVGEADGVTILSSTDVTLRKSTIEDIGGDAVRSSDSARVLIEKCTIQRTGSDGLEFDVDDVLMLPPTNDSIIRKNKFLDIGDDGIDLNGDGHVVEKNRFDDMDTHAVVIEEESSGNTVAKNKVDLTGESAFRIRGDDNTIEKNKVKNAGEHAFNVQGDDNLLLANKVTTADHDGIRARGTRNRYEKNKLKNTSDGLDIEATDSEVIGNKISSYRANGIEIGSSKNATTGNLVEGNKMAKCNGNGLHVHDASDNTFRNNKAKGSGGFDLLDETGAGTNTYEGNQFGTQSGP